MSDLLNDHARGCQGREYTCTCGYDYQREWQPIDTAPKDGSDILLSDSRVSGGFPTVASYEIVDGNDWVWHTNDGISYHEEAFTHWMRLPEPPK